MNDPVVFVVDDDADMRDSLVWLLGTVGLTCKCFANSADFLREFHRDGPSCLVLDVRMPGMSGLDLLEMLTSRGDTPPALFITAYADVPMAVRAMKSGAIEFLEKPFNAQVLLERIQRAIERDTEAICRESLMGDTRDRLNSLSEKEWEVLTFIRQGLPNKTIAARLGLTPRAIELRRASLMKKLGAQSLAELLRMTIPDRNVERPTSTLESTPKQFFSN